MSPLALRKPTPAVLLALLLAACGDSPDRESFQEERGWVPHLVMFGCLFGIASLGGALHLWRSDWTAARKLGWTLVLLVPIFGVIAYAVASSPPEGEEP